MAEADVPGQESAFWLGIVFPAATASDLVQRWHREVVQIVALPEVKARLLAMSLDVVANTPDEFAARIRHDFAAWRPIIERAGMTAFN